MIDDPEPKDWRELQISVHRLLSEIGLTAEIEKKVKTPRGEVEIDVWAVDENSVDQIQYVVECKNWATAVTQTIVHSFTTVMHETGGNIGFIVAKSGFQSGAIDYIQSTNIIGLTYLELQQRYVELWWKKWFVLKIGSTTDALIQYTEPINSRRERIFNELPESKQQEFLRLFSEYSGFGQCLVFFENSTYWDKLEIERPETVAILKDKIETRLGKEFAFQSIYYRDLALEMCRKIEEVTNKFHLVFGGSIFAEQG
jgi:restriction system protein